MDEFVQPGSAGRPTRGRTRRFPFTHGGWGAGLVLGGSLLSWLLVPTALAVRRLGRIDL